MLAEHIGLYEWLKAFHVLLAVVWVGGNVIMHALSLRILASRDGAKMAAFAGDVEWIGNRVFAPSSGLLLILGIWMVIEDPTWDFDQLWIVAAIAMFAYSFLTGLFYLGPSAGKLKKLYEAEGVGSLAAQAVLRRILLASRIELVLLILIVFDMVLKPGL